MHVGLAGAAAPLLCGANHEVRAMQSIRYGTHVQCNDLAQSSSSCTATYRPFGRAIPHPHSHAAAAIGRRSRRARTQGSALVQVTGGVSGSGGAARVRSATSIRSSHLLALRLHSAFDIDSCCHLPRTFSPPNTRSPRRSRFPTWASVSTIRCPRP